ncbi:MAG: glycosyltransferase, partial [Planctomycetota bacterium]
GCQEVVVDDENGYLCRPKDADDLANKMEKLLLLSEEEQAVMGKKGREKIVHEFDEKIVQKAYLSEIEESFGGRQAERAGRERAVRV